MPPFSTTCRVAARCYTVIEQACRVFDRPHRGASERSLRRRLLTGSRLWQRSASQPSRRQSSRRSGEWQVGSKESVVTHEGHTIRVVNSWFGAAKLYIDGECSDTANDVLMLTAERAILSANVNGKVVEVFLVSRTSSRTRSRSPTAPVPRVPPRTLHGRGLCAPSSEAG